MVGACIFLFSLGAAPLLPWVYEPSVLGARTGLDGDGALIGAVTAILATAFATSALFGASMWVSRSEAALAGWGLACCAWTIGITIDLIDNDRAMQICVREGLVVAVIGAVGTCACFASAAYERGLRSALWCSLFAGGWIGLNLFVVCAFTDHWSISRISAIGLLQLSR